MLCEYLKIAGRNAISAVGYFRRTCGLALPKLIGYTVAMKKLIAKLPPWQALFYIAVGTAGIVYLVVSGGVGMFSLPR